MKEDIKEIKALLKKIGEAIKRIEADQEMEDKVFDQWLRQYDPKGEAFYATMYPDVTTKPFDWKEVPDYVSVCKPHNDEYIGGPVAGYCPDYMKEKK